MSPDWKVKALSIQEHDCNRKANIIFKKFHALNTVKLLTLEATLHSGRSYYIDLLLIKMAVLAMFQENWSQFKIPSTN